MAWIESERLKRVIAENGSARGKHLIAWPNPAVLDDNPITERADISGWPFIINGSPEIRGRPPAWEHWGWWPVETLTGEGVEEVEEYASLLWPEMGKLCILLLETKVMRTMLAQSPVGFWIIDRSLAWAAFVATSWEGTLSWITQYELWDKVEYRFPTEAAIAAADEAECQRANRPMSEEELAEYEAILALVNGTGHLTVS